MAEYIDKKYLDRKFQIDMMCLRGGTIFDTKKIINSLPPADVIERSEYEKIKIERDISIQQIHNLGNSVSKAIEEMERYGDGFDDIGKHNLASAVENCISILKRNIGGNYESRRDGIKK